MPIQEFVLDAAGTRRVQLFWSLDSETITVLIDQSIIGNISDQEARTTGLEFRLTDSSVLKVQFVNNQVQVLRNSQPLRPLLPVSAVIPPKSINTSTLRLILKAVQDGARKALTESALNNALSPCQETLKVTSSESSPHAPVTSNRVVFAQCAALAAQHARRNYMGDQPSALDEAIAVAEQRVQPDGSPAATKAEQRNAKNAVTKAEKEASLYASWVGFVGIVLGIFSAFLCLFAFLLVRQLIFGPFPSGSRVDFLGIAVLFFSIGLGGAVAGSLRNAYKRHVFNSAVAKNPQRVASASAAMAAYCAVSVTSTEPKNLYLLTLQAVREAACSIALVEPTQLCELVTAFATKFHSGEEPYSDVG